MMLTSEFVFFLLISTILSFHLICCSANNGIICHETEKQALLSFKRSMKGSSFSSWKPKVDCCKWNGVVCSNLTGHVLQLHLQNSDLSGKFDHSLLNLTQLTYLDLSMNDFNVNSLEWISGFSHLEHLDMSSVNLSKSTNWPQVINKLPSLRELNFASCGLFSTAYLIKQVNNSSPLTILDLSDNNLQVFPEWILQLNELTYLDLSSNYLQGSVPSTANFTNLQHIEISTNNLQVVPKWIFQLNKLTYLGLSSNRFESVFSSTVNLTNLQNIDISDNRLKSTIPDWLYMCKYLEYVSMVNNVLRGSISSAIGNLTSLSFLSLSSNELSGEIPSQITKLCNMQFMYLSYNNLSGNMSKAFGNMSNCFLESLEMLALRHNKLSGHLTTQFGQFRSLNRLDLAENKLSGPLPSNIGKLLFLEFLLLNDNKLTGNLPESFGQLFNLMLVNIDDNMLEGVVKETHFANLTNLDVFVASRNRLTLKVGESWFPIFKASSLGLGSWNLGDDGQIPTWLHTQKTYIDTLDLSNTGIATRVPSWFWEIRVLNLSNNQIHGNIPKFVSGSGDLPRLLYLSSNLFNGSLPRVASTVTEMDLSNNSFSGGVSHLFCDKTSESYKLEVLNLRNNNLSGELLDCWMRWPSLRVLNLGNNNLSGRIPKSIGFLKNVLSLNLFNNGLSGQIPTAVQNCTKLMKIDISNNQLTGEIPTGMGTSLPNLRILVLRSNKLIGKISSNICHLNSLRVLDLSDNNFSGIIPRCVNNFTAMATKSRKLLRFNEGEMGYTYTLYEGVFIESASVATKGSRFQYDTILALVTNIDLSRNNLSGDIPEQMTRLVELRSLNLSGNHLTGLIPHGIGDMKQLESLDLSRNSLSGVIPSTLADLSSLNYLNVSYNNLTGRIPQSTQIMGLPISGFIGNNKLCGLPLTSSCNNNGGDTLSGNREDNGVDKSEDELLYVFSSLGYIVGLSVIFNTLVFKKSWRNAFFGSIDNMWSKICGNKK